MLAYEQLVGVWRKVSVAGDRVAAASLRQVVFLPDHEVWEVFTFRLGYDDEDGAPERCELVDGWLTLRRGWFERRCRCELQRAELVLTWKNGALVRLVREHDPTAVESASKRPAAKPRRYRRIAGLGELRFANGSWEGFVELGSQPTSLLVHLPELASEDEFAAAATQLENVRAWGARSLIEQAAVPLLEGVTEAWTHGDGDPRELPPLAELRELLSISVIEIDAGGEDVVPELSMAEHPSGAHEATWARFTFQGGALTDVSWE